MFPRAERGGHGLLAAETGFHRGDRVHDGDVATVVALAEQVAESLDALRELAHVCPVRHSEVVARRRPFPPAAVRRIVQAVQRQQVVSLCEVGERGVGDLLAAGAPAAAVVALQPHARPPVQMRDRAGDLVLDEVAAEARLVAARPLIPALGAEVVAKLDDVATAPAVVAAVDHAALLVPLEDRLEVGFLRQRDHHVAVVQPHLGRARPDVAEQRRQLGHDVVTFAPAELLGEPGRPQVAADAERQLVGEEEVQPLADLAGEAIFELPEELLRIGRTRFRIHRVE